VATISELIVKIVADTTGFDSGIKGATDSLNKAGDSSKGATEKFGQLKDALVSAGLIAAFVAVAKGISDCVKEFASAELAAKRLDAVATMRGLEGGTERIQELAQATQELTGASGDMVAQYAAELLAQGKTIDQTVELIQAATQLSAITGDDLSTSVKQLTNTYSGMAGTIGRAIPEIKDLTAEQLKNGEAVAIINDKYGGLAETMTNTVDVAVKRSNEAIGDFKETIGQAFSGTVVAGANALTAALNGMMPFFEYVSTHSFSRMFQELYESIFNVKEEYTLWEEAMASAKSAEIEANRVSAQRVQNLKDIQNELTKTIAATKEMSDEELVAARATLNNILMTTKGTAGLSELKKKIDILDKEIAARRDAEAKKSSIIKQKADKDAADAAIKEAEEEAKARQDKEKKTKEYVIAQEDLISKAKADAYGDSIIASAKERDAKIVDAKKASEEQQKYALQAADALIGAADAYIAAVQAGYAQSIAAVDAETQAKLVAAGLQEDTTLERIQKELDAAIAAGDTELAAEKTKELARAKIVEDGERAKSKIKYAADMASWKASLAMAVVDAARAIIVGFAQLGPIGGAIAAVGTAVTTKLQINAIKKSKPVAPAFARGTDFAPGGEALVGEEGPELISLPRGSSVTPNNQLRGAGSGVVVNIFSPTAVTPSEASSVFTRTARNLAFQGVL